MKSSDHHNARDARFVLSVRQPVRPETTAPCQVACPNGGDIRTWIGFVAQHERLGLTRSQAIERAWRKIVERNPFPATLGRICPHPCESGCNRSAKEGPVAINAMERFIGDWAIEHELGFERMETGKPETVAVIGAGPAGLSFAYQMARRGYRVTVFESKEKAGGMLRYGIPDYRMPPHVLDAEIDRIVRIGVKVNCGSRIDPAAVEGIRERFNIVFSGVGAQKGLPLGIEGDDGPGVWIGTEFLARINQGETVELGPKTIVIGGGNTAIDVARTALRLGSKPSIVYRRTREEMPANANEIDDALDEGVEIRFLAAPISISRNKTGEIEGVVFQKMRLGDPDSSGRRKPVPVLGSRFSLDATTVVAAVAQVPDGDAISPARFAANGQAASGILFGGDVVVPGIAGAAIVQGRKAAEAIHQRLYGVEPGPDYPETVVTSDDLVLGHYSDAARIELPVISAAERIGSLTTETKATLDEDAFFVEAARCMSCGACFGCTNCFMYCNADCYSLVEVARPGSYFALDLTLCEGCTKCIELCPSATIQ